jgi:hypothetical protein
MATVEQERTEEQIQELERLWAAPAARRRPRPLAVALAHLPRAIALAWLVFVAGVFALEPASNPAATVPVWAEATLAAFWLALLCAGVLALVRLSGPALAGSAAAGLVGIVVGYACGATDHHLGAWWMVEAGVCGTLGLLSLAALAARRR